MISIWNKIENKLSTLNNELVAELANPLDSLIFTRFLDSRGIESLDFVESLKIHDGQAYGFHALAYPWQLFNSTEIIRQSENLEASFLNDDFTEGLEARGSVKSLYWNRQWIPFAGNNMGNFLCVDYDPNTGGNNEQVILWASDPPYVEVIAPSYRAWLEQYLSDLEAGKFVWNNQENEWSRQE